MKRPLRWVLPLVVVLAAVWPAVAAAASPQWREQRTRHFTVIYDASQEADAQQYIGFADNIADFLGQAYQAPVIRPVTLRLYPTDESYIAVNPMAAAMRGVIAHAVAAKREIAIAMSRTQGFSEGALENNVRHELTHLIMSDLSGDNLPVGFQEGIAQYAEKPLPELETLIDLLRQANDDGELVTWADLNEPGGTYKNPQIGYPESYAIVAFLIDRYGMPKFLDFVRSMQKRPGYRSALERTYGVPADVLESEWHLYLPEFLVGRWQVNVLYKYDLSGAEKQLSRGAYAVARQDLEQAIDLLKTTQPDQLAHAQELLVKADQGQRAIEWVNDARQALLAGEFARAGELAGRARAALGGIGNGAHIPELREYEARSAEGLRAMAELNQARVLIDQMRYPEAQRLLEASGRTFQDLGDTSNVVRVKALMELMGQRERTAGLAVLALGGLVAMWNAWRRRVERRAAPAGDPLA